MSAAALQPIREACDRNGIEPTPALLWASVADQRMAEFRQVAGWGYAEERRLIISTSRFGIGQAEDSNKTPLGLHRIAEKIGDDLPEARRVVAEESGRKSKVLLKSLE